MNKKKNLEENPNWRENSLDGQNFTLVLHNDDVHDFTYVIDSLVDVMQYQRKILSI